MLYHTDQNKFEELCKEKDFNRKYIPFLPFTLIEVILVLSDAKMTHYRACRVLSNLNRREYSRWNLKSDLLHITKKLWSLESYAKIFKIDSTLPIPSLESFQEIVSEYRQAIKL